MASGSAEQFDDSSYERYLAMSSSDVSMQYRKVTSVLKAEETIWCRSAKLANFIFLTISLLNICVAIGLTIAITSEQIEFGHPLDPEMTLCAVIFVNCAFCMYYAVRGLLKEIQQSLWNFAASIIIIILYCIVDVLYNNNKKDNTFLLVRLGVLVGLSLPNLAFCYQACKYLNLSRFRIVGASEAIQVMYSQLCYFNNLLTLDLQASITYVIFRLNQSSKLQLSTIIILASGIPLCALFNVFGHIAAQWEIKWLVWIFAAVSTLQPVYIILDITKIYIHKIGDMECLILYAILIAGALSISIRAILFCELRPVYKNFGFGLQDKAFAGLVACERTSLLSPPSR